MPTQTKSRKSSKKFDQLLKLKGKKLVKELETQYQQLRKTNDRAEFSGFDSLFNELTKEEFTKNQNREVTRLVGYCLVEMARFVDETELSDSISKEIWSLILQNLKSMESPSKNENYRRSFEMFEKIYQTALLKIVVSFGGEDNDVLFQFFQMIIDIIDAFSGLPSPSKRPSRTKKSEAGDADTQFTEEELQQELERVRGISMQIMIAIIDLYRKIPYSLLDIILSNLIVKDDSIPPAHVQLLTDLLSVKKAKLAPSIQKLFTDIMVDSSVSSQGYDVCDHINPILIKLNSISSEYIELLLPLITSKLSMDESVRLETVQCLNSIFSTKGYDFLSQSAAPFEEYLNRFRDKSAAIRQSISEAANSIIEAQPAALERMLPYLKERIKDPQWEIRKIIVNTFYFILANHFDDADTECIQCLIERTIDKRVEVRRWAIAALINTLNFHLRSSWSNKKRPSRQLASRLGMICGVFLQCYGVSNDETRNRCCELLNDRFIDECRSEEAVAIAYIWFFEQLQKSNDYLKCEDSVATMDQFLRSFISDWQKLQKSLRQLTVFARESRSIEDDAVGKLLMQLSRSLCINQASKSVSIYTTTNNCLFALYSLCVPSLDSAEPFDKEQGNQLITWLEVIANPISQTDDLKKAADGLKAVLNKQPEGKKLRLQFKTVFPRFYCRFCSSELIFMYLKMINEYPSYRSSAFQLLQVIAEEGGSAFMCSDVQLGLFSLLHHSLNAMIESTPDSLEDVGGKKNNHAMRNRLMKLLATSSKYYESYPFALLNNDPSAEWNAMYTTDLLPLFDLLVENLSRFEFCEVKHAVTLFSCFCRFIASNDSDVDQSIRIRYNEWIEEFLSRVPYQTNPSLMKIQLSAVNCLLKVDPSYPNNVGIRELVDRIIHEFEQEEKQSFVDSEEMCLLYITFLNNYLCALKMEGDAADRVLSILYRVFMLQIPTYEINDDIKSVIQYKAFVSLMKIATNRCYVSFFSPQRFYEIGLKLEEIDDTERAREYILKISSLIRNKLLPMKYMCYMLSAFNKIIFWFLQDEDIQSLIKSELNAVILQQRKFLMFYQTSHGSADSSDQPPLYQFAPEYSLIYFLPLFSRLKAYDDMSDSPSKIQIRCIHITLNAFIAANNDNFGLVNAIISSILVHQDRLNPSNVTLQRLATLCSQLLHQRLQVIKNVDVTYGEAIRLPSQYYASMHREVQSRITPSSLESPVKEDRQSDLSFVTPEKSRRLSTSTRGVSEEGDTPLQLKNMSPIEENRKRKSPTSNSTSRKRRKSI